MQMCVGPMGWEYLLEEEMATYSSILAGKTPWTEEPGGLQSMWSESDVTEPLSMYAWLVHHYYKEKRDFNKLAD